ncbi:MAG: hypothetical protein CMM78_04575 [Rhodospirillaceae bacterium]|uniref:DUF4168 domain-containing protein n=1 Tax=Hwanghaeella sp. 1Z406 TaxID=3402811 RepID=UPI000C60F110|nr:hypothetical protein [Rhodospirillales bacterium]MAX47462.1 hypothetical protein [Rhodospirillaceae bacterium]
MTIKTQLKAIGSSAMIKSMIVVGALTIGAATGPALADSSTPASQKITQEFQLTQSAAADISDAQLQSFASAQSSVVAIQEEWQSRVDSGEVDPNDPQAVEDIRTQMAMAVEQAGLSVEQYNMIFETLQTDPELRQRYQGMQ